MKLDRLVFEKANSRFYGFLALSNCTVAALNGLDYKTNLITPSEWAIEVLQIILAAGAILPYFRSLDALDELRNDSANI